MSPEAIKSQLENVVAQIDDLITNILRAAVAEGASERPEAERQLTRVRRSVEKAILQLERVGAADESMF